MDKIIYSVRLDVQKGEYQAVLHGFKVGDTAAREIRISLHQNGIPIQLDEFDNVIMFVKKAWSAVPSVNACRVENNAIIYDVLQSDTASDGEVEFTVRVQDGERIAYAPKFSAVVVNSDGSTVVPPGTTYTVLDSLIGDVQALQRVQGDYATKEEISGLASKEELEGLVTKEEAEDFITREEAKAEFGNGDYNDLSNIPTIEGVDVIGNKTLKDYGTRKIIEMEYEDYAALSEYELDAVYLVKNAPSSGGAASYAELPDKPSINGRTLVGNKTADELGLATKPEVEAVAEMIPTDYVTKSYVDGAIETAIGGALNGTY